MPDLTAEDALEKCLRQHEEVRELIQEVRGFLEEPRPRIGVKGYHTWAAGLAEHLLTLHDKLFRHFRDEEQDGVMEELILRNPGASNRIDALEKDHGGMLQEIRLLMDATMVYSEGKEPPDVRLRRRTLGILERLAEHEAAENELIASVEYMDLGESG